MAIFLPGLCNFVLCLVKEAEVVLVLTVNPTAAVTVISVTEVILSTILVTVSPSSSRKVIWSPIFNSVVNEVPLPSIVFCV